MRIELDKHVEDEKYYTCRPPQSKEQPTLRRTIKAGDGEEAVRHKVTHQDQVYYTPEYQPRIVLEWRFLELVVLWNLGLHLALDQIVYGRMRVFTRLGILKYMRVLRPEDEAVVLGLAFEKPTNACIVCSSPKEEYGGENGFAGACWADVECEYQAGEHSKNGKVGKVLWLRGREKLRDHIMSLWHNKH